MDGITFGKQLNIMKQTRPIIFFDIESTGTNPAQDKIIELAYKKVFHFDTEAAWQVFRFNPGMPIPPEATECHGITDADVKDEPYFRERCNIVMSDFFECDLAGFNLTNFDVPILWEELYRCGLTWNLEGVNIIDAGTIFKIKEERTLTAAMKFYCQREHEGAHSGKADVTATQDVLLAQLIRYPELQDMTIEQLAKFSQRNETRCDLAGKIVLDKDGDPAYTFGEKTRGVKVKNDIGFAQWMLRKDFSANTKMVLSKILDSISTQDDTLPLW